MTGSRSAATGSPGAAPIRGIDRDAPVPGTWLLVTVLVAVHLATALSEWRLGLSPLVDGLLFTRDLRFRVSVGGNLHEAVADGEIWRLWTCVLLHADAVHLLVNATALAALGRILEPWIGSVRLLVWFTFGGLSGAVASHGAGVFQSDGASGGAFALLTAAILLAHADRQHLEERDRRLLGPGLWTLLIVNLGLGFVLPFVDVVAHLGGLLAGVVIASAVGLARHPAIRVVEGLWLLAFAAVCGIGWSVRW